VVQGAAAAAAAVRSLIRKTGPDKRAYWKQSGIKLPPPSSDFAFRHREIDIQP